MACRSVKPLPSDAEKQRWLEYNEAVGEAERIVDRERPQEELLKETPRLKAVMEELSPETTAALIPRG